MITQNFIEGVNERIDFAFSLVGLDRPDIKELAKEIVKSELQSFARKVVGEIARVKDTVASSQGSGKYDSCYDDCIYIVSSLSGLSGEDNSQAER